MGCGMIPQRVCNLNWAANLDPNLNKILSHRWYFRFFNMNLSAPLNPGTWVRLHVLGICLEPLCILLFSGCMQGTNWPEFLKKVLDLWWCITLGPLFRSGFLRQSQTFSPLLFLFLVGIYNLSNAFQNQ